MSGKAVRLITAIVIERFFRVTGANGVYSQKCVREKCRNVFLNALAPETRHKPGPGVHLEPRYESWRAAIRGQGRSRWPRRRPHGSDELSPLNR